MAISPSLGKRWENYRPSKGGWFWSCAGCIVATVVLGFTWGGWVTGGTATKMSADAAAGASAQLAAADCIHRFESGPNAAMELAALKKAESYERGDLINHVGRMLLPHRKRLWVAADLRS